MAKHSALLILMALAIAVAAPSAAFLVQPQPNLLTYHKGAVLSGDIPVSILWYGSFTPAQKAVVSDFLLSLSATPAPRVAPPSPVPSVAQWWSSINQLYLSKAAAVVSKNGGAAAVATSAWVVLSRQVSDEGCSLGKSLNLSQLPALAARARGPAKAAGGIALVLTARDVAVEGFCMSRCGHHGSDPRTRAAYAWVGNPADQCPGQCAWPFHQPAYGPQAPPLVPPSGDAGMLDSRRCVAEEARRSVGAGWCSDSWRRAVGWLLRRASASAPVVRLSRQRRRRREVIGAADCQTSKWALFGSIARVGLSCCALTKSKSASAVGWKMDGIREGESHL